MILAIICCLPFFLFQNYKTNYTFATSQIENVTPLKINSALNVNREVNRSLVKKGTDEFFDGYIYSVKSDVNGAFLTMNFVIDSISIDNSKSLYLWVFLPALTMPDLVIVANDLLNSSSFSWRFKGTETQENENYEFSLENVVESYNGQVSKGWKLLQLTFDDAVMSGAEFESINSISVSSSFLRLSESAEYEDLSITYPFIADNLSETTSIVDHQGYVVYAEKQSFLDLKSNIYAGDSIDISSEKDFFVYVIVGKQNILDNKSGYSWNLVLNEPSGYSKNLALDRKLNIIFDKTGYYSLDINLLTSDQDVYPIISKNYAIYVDEFIFGYFPKKEYSFDLNSTNAIVMTLSNDFELADANFIVIDVSDKNIAEATYYIKNNKIFFNIKTLKEGTIILNVSANGIKINDTQPENYETTLKISVEKPKENTDFKLLGLLFVLFVTGFVVYIVILFVKSRRFGVK